MRFKANHWAKTVNNVLTRLLLQNGATGEYFSGGETCVQDEEQAFEFCGVDAALEYAYGHACNSWSLVVVYPRCGRLVIPLQTTGGEVSPPATHTCFRLLKTT